MRAAGLPGHGEIVGFAARIARGELSEVERADVAVLVVLLGSGLRTHAAVRAQHPDDRVRQDEFAVRVWQLACEVFAMTLPEPGR